MSNKPRKLQYNKNYNNQKEGLMIIFPTNKETSGTLTLTSYNNPAESKVNVAIL